LRKNWQARRQEASPQFTRCTIGSIGGTVLPIKGEVFARSVEGCRLISSEKESQIFNNYQKTNN